MSPRGGARPGAGRKNNQIVVPEDLQLTKQKAVRFSETESKRLETAAEDMGMTCSAFIHAATIEQLDRYDAAVAEGKPLNLVGRLKRKLPGNPQKGNLDPSK